MINADEHKKLLAQITELEKNSVNYFDVEKEFFLIDSDNLSQVRPRLYGYSIQRTGIYEDDNLTPDAIAGLDGRGCYVYVDVQDNKITIKQDLNGCWGIYLFRHGNYFALSNSFFRLLDHIKFKYPLTVNRDYCLEYMTRDLRSSAYSETAVNEIQFVDRNSIFTIDVPEKKLQIESIDYKEHTVPLNSEEGIVILDNWIDFWCDVIRGIAQNTQFIQADLSGGFDSRISFIPLLHSGIDLNEMLIFSIKGNLHTHKEDYEIASKIAAHYNFNLNQPLPVSKFLNYSLADNWNIEKYNYQTVRNVLVMIFSTKKRINKIYHIKGMGGEGIRKYFSLSKEEFLHKEIIRTTFYSSNISNEISHSIKNILESAFKSACNKYKTEEENSILQLLWIETSCRNHFGKESLYDYLKNRISISPIIDPELRKIQLNTPECSDVNLLMALIFTRYEPGLLKFPFEGRRSIAPETIEYAKKINERFPLVKKDKANVPAKNVFYMQPRDTQAEKILSSGRNNPAIPGGLPEACLKAIFESSKTYGLFTSYFDEELYHYAAAYYDTHVFARERPMYSIVGVTKVLEDVEISQRNYPKYQDMKRFLDQDLATIHEDEQILLKFKNYFTARIDVKLMSTAGDFKILSVSDDKAMIWKPDWLQKGGSGYHIQSYVGKLEMVAKATVNGQINLELKGLDVKDPKDKSKRIPYWIDYTKLTVNGKVIFDKLTPAWHDKFYHHIINAKANTEVKIQVEWLPHRSDI